MKTIIAIFALTALSFSVYQTKMISAYVNQVDGIYIFIDSKPVQEYTVLGEVKSAINDDYEGYRDDLINKAKKKFQGTTAIIIHPPHQNLPTAEAIKFKD